MKIAAETHITQTPKELIHVRDHPMPVFPTQALYAVTVFICIHRNHLTQVMSGAEISWVICADDAHPIKGGETIDDFNIVQVAVQSIEGVKENGDSL